MFGWLFHHKEKMSAPPGVTEKPGTTDSIGLPISTTEQKIVTLISAAIAAKDYPNSIFKVNKITKIKNRTGLPMTIIEKDRVAVIASAILAGDQKNSQFRVKSIIKLS
ncbi:hypothetical protein ACNAN0_02160 [Agrilactobacillus fermenti]|uniref:hypothetical protein n=1 Tax=Agrilactobacillus fermenti TaxID=2586909 RepID=UPI003A5BD345